MSATYGHVTKLFLGSEFQHKGNKQMKKSEFSAKSCIFLGKIKKKRQIQKINLFKYYTHRRGQKKKWKKLSSLGQEPTFKIWIFETVLEDKKNNKTVSAN